jgi:hypothetical protein
MPLGKKIPNIRSKAFLKANPEAFQKLSDIGFEFDGKAAANDSRFNTVFDALVRYKELNGDLLVPQPFIVPEGSDEWSEELWGLRLGARVNAIRSQGTFVKTDPARKQMLDDIGFEWEIPAAGKKRGRKKKAENDALAGPAPPGLLESQSLGGDDIKVKGGKAASFIKETPAFSDIFNEASRDDSPSWVFEDQEMEQKILSQQLKQQPQQQKQQQAEMEFLPPKNLNSTLEEMAKIAMEVGVLESMG